MVVEKLIIVGIIVTLLNVILRDVAKEISVFIRVLFSIFVFIGILPLLNTVIDGLNYLSTIANIPVLYLTLILKLVGIAYLVYFATEFCKDSGMGSVAEYLEFGGKIIVMSISFPVLLEMVTLIIGIFI